jgi:hypothetical protein
MGKRFDPGSGIPKVSDGNALPHAVRGIACAPRHRHDREEPAAKVGQRSTWNLAPLLMQPQGIYAPEDHARRVPGSSPGLTWAATFSFTGCMATRHMRR